MNSRPAKYGFHRSLISMDVYSFRWCYLMIRTTITDYIDQAVGSDIIYKPRDLIGMSFNYYFKICFRIYYSDRSSIVINEAFINVRFQVIQPHFLSGIFKSGRRWIVDIFLKKLERFFINYSYMFLFIFFFLTHF